MSVGIDYNLITSVAAKSYGGALKKPPAPEARAAFEAG